MRCGNDPVQSLVSRHRHRCGFHSSSRHGAAVNEQLAMASVAFSFAGMCIGYWLCLAVNRPRNDAAPQVPDRRFDIQAEIERTRREVAALKRQKRAYAAKERRLQVLTAWSL